MRILLTANASYVPPRGGATRSNLVWLEHLTAAGHECRVVAAAPPADSPQRRAQLEAELSEQGYPLGAMTPNVAVFHRAALIYPVSDPVERIQALHNQLRVFQPDWVLVSSEDVGQVLLREALESAHGRVVYLAHTPQFFPFGPQSWSPNPQGAGLMSAAAGIVAIGNHMAAYIERYSGCPATVVHPPIYGAGPYPNYFSESGSITMINPCGIKGGSVFLELARRLPDYPFAALPGWGTTAADRAALASCRNVTLLPHCNDIGDILRRTRVLLMPSLWYEGFGLIVVQAMLHGIPVVASDSGGLAEAKLGTRFVIPVNPIERYEPEYDEHAIPRAVIPPQDMQPWEKAVRTLMGDAAVCRQESDRAREAALRFVQTVRPEALGDYLSHLQPALTAPMPRPEKLVELSQEKRALLLERLRRRSGH